MSAGSAGRLSSEDERLALSSVDRTVKQSGRKYRCNNCGLMFTTEDLNPDHDYEGRRIGWLCDGCY